MREPFYFERDLSWLQFNHRVLQEAASETVPLYERLKFLAIFSSNLDEFYRVRVSSLRSFRKMKDLTENMTIKPKEILKKIQKIVQAQQEEFGRIFAQEIKPELERNDIYLIRDTQYTPEQAKFASEYFDSHLRDKVIPHLLIAQNIKVWLENRALYLVVQLDEQGEKVAILPIPGDTDRFVVLPKNGDRNSITFVDDIIRANITKIFPLNGIHGIYAIKMSRDAELYLGDEFSGDLIARLKERVQERKKGLPTRFLYDLTMPDVLVKKLRKTLNISKYDLIPGGRYHNFHDFFAFPDPTASEIFNDTPQPPLPHPVLEESSSLIEAILEKDQIMHFPYQSYEYIPRLIREAADDPSVKKIKITLYRVAHQSKVATALLYALEKGKKVFCFIEAKARFDEESNLFWGNQLAAAGALVRYSFPAIKVHCKLMLIERKADDKKQLIAYLGTGNFNEKTAKIYADHALLTGSKKIGKEVSRVFEMLEGKVLAPQCKKLLVSPFTTRSGFLELIDREIRNAAEGVPAWMILKMNSLEDRRMIQKLYEASEAGVKVRLIIRGICCLVPGVEGLSSNIEVTSIVDRFLEHARVYIFANGGNEEMYLASADFMTRNLDRRVEVVFPIKDDSARAEIRKVIDLQLEDNVKARIIDEHQTNSFVPRLPGEKAVRSQKDAYLYFKSLVPEGLNA